MNHRGENEKKLPLIEPGQDVWIEINLGPPGNSFHNIQFHSFIAEIVDLESGYWRVHFQDDVPGLLPPASVGFFDILRQDLFEIPAQLKSGLNIDWQIILQHQHYIVHITGTVAGEFTQSGPSFSPSDLMRP